MFPNPDIAKKIEDKWNTLYRRRSNLDVNLWLMELTYLIEHTKVSRVVIDGLSDLLATTEEKEYANWSRHARLQFGGRDAAESRESSGVNPVSETNRLRHTRRSTFFPTQTSASPSQWSSAGEAEAGSGGDQPAEE